MESTRHKSSIARAERESTGFRRGFGGFPQSYPHAASVLPRSFLAKNRLRHFHAQNRDNVRKGKVGLQQVMHFQYLAFALEGSAADLSRLNQELSLALAKKEQVTDAALQGKHERFSTGSPHPAHNDPSPPSLRRPPGKKEARARD